MQLQLGLAFPVYLPKDGQSVPGMLVPALLPDRDVEVRLCAAALRPNADMGMLGTGFRARADG